MYQISLSPSLCSRTVSPSSSPISPSFFPLSHSFSVSFSSHQAAERQIRSWFTVQLNVVIETLLQKKKKKKTACRFHPALIGLPLACACVRTRVLLCVFVLLCVSNALVGTSRLRFFFTFKEGRLKFRLCTCECFCCFRFLPFFSSPSIQPSNWAVI